MRHYLPDNLLKGHPMKGYLTGAISALLASPLLPSHPVLYVATTTGLIILSLSFWTGAVRVAWK